MVVGTWGVAVVDQLQGASTLVVPVFDLGLLVPLAIFTGLAVWRMLPLGYLLASMVLVKGASMALAIASMLMVEADITGELALPPLLVFSVLALVSLVLGARALRSLEAAATAVRCTSAAQRAVQPPSTMSVVPVTSEAAGEAR